MKNVHLLLVRVISKAIRFTGEYDKNVDGTLNYRRPHLEAVQLDSEIDENGNFFFRVPMNMRYVITNEFGETVTTKDRNKGIATRSTYRFRFHYKMIMDKRNSIGVNT